MRKISVILSIIVIIGMFWVTNLQANSESRCEYHKWWGKYKVSKTTQLCKILIGYVNHSYKMVTMESIDRFSCQETQEIMSILRQTYDVINKECLFYIDSSQAITRLEIVEILFKERLDSCN